MPQPLQRPLCQGATCRQCLPGYTGPATPGHWQCQAVGCNNHAVQQWLVTTSTEGDTVPRYACNTCNWPTADDRSGRIHQTGCAAPDRDGSGNILCHCTWS